MIDKLGPDKMRLELFIKNYKKTIMPLNFKSHLFQDSNS